LPRVQTVALGPIYAAQKLSENDELRGLVLLMRHGETVWNREGRVMGTRPVRLSDEGRIQIRAAAMLAKAFRPELIVTSPLVRARESASILAAELEGVTVLEDERLQEVRYGHWEGMTYDKLLQDEHYRRYREEPLELPTPGGEKISEVQQRGVAALTETVAANHGKRILFMSHGDIIRTILCHFMNLRLQNFRRLRVDNGALSAVDIAGDFAEVKFVNLLPDPGRIFAAPFPTSEREISR
jgi:phosphoserine phosphatase